MGEDEKPMWRVAAGGERHVIVEKARKQYKRDPQRLGCRTLEGLLQNVPSIGMGQARRIFHGLAEQHTHTRFLPARPGDQKHQDPYPNPVEWA